MPVKRLSGGSAAVLALCLVSTAAQAGTSEALLKRLHDKGILSDDEYAELLKDEQSEQAKPAPVAATATATATATEQAQGALDMSHVVKMTDTGIGMVVGPATIKFSGSVNGFYVYDSPQKNPMAVVGGLASTGANGTSSVRNGLLPGFLKIEVSTTQAGWDVGAHFGMYPGINSAAWGALGANNGGQPTAFATSGIDFRQTYMTFGKKGIGEFKIGRDIGLFGSDAILNDITLLSVGTTGGNAAPGNTSLGRIGIGYIYTDFQPQITYTTPSLAGLQASVGVFQPLNSLTSPVQQNSSPGIQGKVTYDTKLSGAALHLWLSGISQKHDTGIGTSYTGDGVDLGGKVTVGPLALLGYWYTAKGLGTEALGLFDVDASGLARKSDGYYVQAMATFGKFSIGGSYGASLLNTTGAVDALANPTLVHKNASSVGQMRYGLTSWVTLIGEYTHTKAVADNGNTNSSDAVSVGGILFF
jgi:hypothetical protein